MTESVVGLRHKIGSAGDLHSIVRTMKAVAASNIGQYENAALALEDYYRTVQLGLTACFNGNKVPVKISRPYRKKTERVCAIVFGSSQGLVGQFNDAIAEFVIDSLLKMPEKAIVWTVGEQIRARLEDTDLEIGESFDLPNSIGAITSLLEQTLIKIEAHRDQGDIGPVILFYNRPISGEIYSPMRQCLLPMDEVWEDSLKNMTWPTNNLPEVLNSSAETLSAYLREYLFVSIFRACVESQTSENFSRLAAMQRAEKNIEEMLEDLNKDFQHIRQNNIDEELFELISGFEALTKSTGQM